MGRQCKSTGCFEEELSHGKNLNLSWGKKTDFEMLDGKPLGPMNRGLSGLEKLH